MTTTERDLEDSICDSLVRDGGYREVKVGTSTDHRVDFDPSPGLDTVELFTFLINNYSLENSFNK